MQIAISLFLSTLRTFVDVLQLMMFVRAIMSWVPALAESRLADFLYTVTEWVIMPVRAVFERLGFGNNMMIDMPFFFTFILLSIAGSML